MNNHRIPPKPDYFDTSEPGTCRWCNTPVGPTAKNKPSRSRWHAACVNEYKLLFWPSATRKAVWKRDNGKCKCCGILCTKRGVDKWHMDHIVPLIESNGDLTYWQLSNLQTLCLSCHTVKTSAEATARALVRKQLKADKKL